ncbi:MAG: hypothetical protein Q9212_002345 [Teloschistes hypoglaucus]
MASRARYCIAKTVACNWYIIPWVVAIISPFVFISSVIINEIYVWGYPVSEKFDAVGQVSRLTLICRNETNGCQWSPWVSAILVLIAAVIQEYHLFWLKILKQALRLQKRTVNSKSVKEDEEDSKAESVSRGRDRIVDEWKDFRLWWQHPSIRSRQPHYKRLRSSPELPSLRTSSSQIQLLAANPPSFTTLAPQTPGSSITATSPYPETPYVPQPPSTARINHPAPLASAPGYFDGSETTHETVQRPTFERETSEALQVTDERYQGITSSTRYIPYQQ